MSDKAYIDLCKKMIADRYPMGKGHSPWKQRDMETLSRLIEERSGIKLSLSTLKRLWKTDFNQTPHPSTLDALVSVLDCSNWLEFKSRYHTLLTREHTANDLLKKNALFWLLLISAFIFVGFLIIGPALDANNHEPLGTPKANGPIHFSANKTVATGVPNTVIFKYDVQNIQADSFFIQQSWNELHKEAIDPDAKNFSSLYYTPGFHRAKLIANDSVFEQSRVHIKTDGWLALARYSRDDLVPIYVKDPTIGTGGSLHVSSQQLLQAGVDMDRSFRLSYHNVREFEGLESDNFQLRTRIRCDSTGNYVCPEMTLTILCEEHIFYVPLTTKGCVGNLAIKFGEVVNNGDNSDLSAFGRDIYNWQDLKISVINKHAQVHVADSLVFETTFRQNFGKIMGLIYSFNGLGSVEFLEVRDPEQRMLYHELFR